MYLISRLKPSNLCSWNLIKHNNLEFLRRRMKFTFSILKNVLYNTIRTDNNLHLVRMIAREQNTSEQTHKTNLMDATTPEELMVLLHQELEKFRQFGFYVPSHITDEQWIEIIHLKKRLMRIKYYRYLFDLELKRAKRAVHRKTKLEEIESDGDVNHVHSADSLSYGLGKNTLYSNIKAESLNNLYNSWTCHSIMFGEKLVLDLGYSDQMTRRELNNCCEQIKLMASHNRANRQPFDFYFCNLLQDTTFHHLMLNKFPNLFSDWCLINITDKSYLDLFPKEKLVYLTPHCDNDMTHFDFDATYIIGGLVDKSNSENISSVKAEKEGLRMARLPLDLHLDWGIGTKNLTLDQMVKILLELKESGDWKKAFMHIPQRKLKNGRRKYINKKEIIRMLHGPH